ncbi:MAG: DUF4199 domain-containing protein [Bacteroidia bacterium]|jgi:hypothetical protein|nr:DUF4199 domain-containing protein [Bacteroidia bacterium]
MYKSWQFLLVMIVTGLFTGLIAFVVYLGLLSFIHSIFSPVNLLLYIVPFVGMWIAAVRLRNRYNYGMMRFGQGFRISFSTGFVSALVFSGLVYYLFSGLLEPLLNQRINTLVGQAVLENPSLGLEELNNRKELVHRMMAPLSQAVYFFAFNFVLLPVSAFLIAIFARRRGRILNEEE